MYQDPPDSGKIAWLQKLGWWRTAAGRWIFAGGKSVLNTAGPVLRGAWRTARPVLRIALQVVLALFILLEEWGWRPLAELLGRFARWRPWAQMETAIARLPPYAALLVFIVPSALLLPLKFLAVFLVAQGQLVLAALLFAGAKVVATALVARLFMLTQPALMQIGWFAWTYDTVMPWKDTLVERVRESLVWRTGRLWKERARRVLVAQLRGWRPTFLELRALALAAASKARAQLRLIAHKVKARLAALQQ